jgi:Ca2+/Na+ antiporter
MELDEFKSTFQLLNQQVQNVPVSQLNEMLHTKTESAVSKIKRSLIFEMVLSIAFIVGILLVALRSENWALRIYFFIFLPIICLFVLYMYSMYRKLIALQKNADQPIRSNLQMIQKLIRNYCKHYMQLTMWMMPICFLLSLVLAFVSPENGTNTLTISALHINSAKGLLIFLLAYFIIIWVGIYYFNRWYLDRLYGRYLRQLQNEMEELAVE